MNPCSYARVCEDEESDPVEVPLEIDQTLLLPTLVAQFPTCTGLKYKPADSTCFRGLRLVDDRIYPPGENGWTDTIFYCVFPKDKKRKADDESEDSKPKVKCADGRKCTDLIVLNLPWHTDEIKLRNYFSKFGEVVMAQIKRDPATGKSRGYGFVRFGEYSAQVMCLSDRHIIDDRQCEVRIPFSKIEGDRQEVNRKIHVSRLTEDVGIEALRDHFSKYGSVTDVFIPKPFRSFAFVTFEDPDVAASLMGEEMQIGECNVVIGSAVPKLPSQRPDAFAYPGHNDPSNPYWVGQRGGPYGASPRSGFHSAWPPTFGMFSNAPPPHGGSPMGRGGAGGPAGLSPVTAAAAAALAAQYTRAHQRQSSDFNGAGMRGGPDLSARSNPTPDASNSAAMATLNILNNPNVVAAIVSAATGAGNASASAAFPYGVRR